jgi:molybdopterin-containing oxidoreductase family iron-sulfur binding subunit
VLVESNMGRPTKIEGNPTHPSSLGSTDISAQASVLDLWDPDRSQVVTRNGQIDTWENFGATLQRRLAALADKQGDGLRILTVTVTSPTLAAQIDQLLKRYPRARWHQYDAINRDNIYDGTRTAFGETLDVRYALDKAQIIVSLDADFLGAGNARVRSARDFSHGRGAADGETRPNRLYAAASIPTLTSAMADHPLAVRAADIETAARNLAVALGCRLEHRPRYQMRARPGLPLVRAICRQTAVQA